MWYNLTIVIGMYFVAFFLSHFLFRRAWVWLHEYSHLYMAKLLVGVTKYEMILYPHYNERVKMNVDGIVSYWPKRVEKTLELVAIKQAPRITELMAIAALPFIITGMLYTMDNTMDWSFMVLCFLSTSFSLGGLTSFISGASEKDPPTDLQQTAKVLQLKPWRISVLLSTIGVFVFLISIASVKLAMPLLY